jgi:hypothetical protein
MTKLTLSFILIASVLFSQAQTIVSTQAENKNVILEEFTGIYCGYCPSGHAIAQGIKDDNPDDVFLINIHTGGFAAPSGSHPDFRTQFGSAIAGQSGLTGYPAGTVNRYVFDGLGMTDGGTAMSRADWSAASGTILSQQSYLNVGVEAEIDVSNREITVYTEVYYTGDSPEASNFLNIALLQDSTIGFQSGGSSEYNHMHRLVWMITDQWGQEITSTSQGSFYSETFTYTIPEDYNGIEAKLKDLKIVAFVSETQQNIISGNGCMPTFTNHPNDVYLKDVTTDPTVCKESLAPTVTVGNSSASAIEELTFEYGINGGQTQTYTWTGSIASLNELSFDLPELSYSQEAVNNLNVEIINNDDNAENNTGSTSFDKAVTVSTTVRLDILTDEYPDELSWQVLNAAGEIVYSGDSYQTGSVMTIEESFDLPAGCYTFIVEDSYGDGLTYPENGHLYLTDSNGTEIMSYPNGVYGLGDAVNFGTDESLAAEIIENTLTIYPNPATNHVTIANAENATISIYDISGKLVLKNQLSGSKSSIDISRLKTGSYIIKAETQNKVYTDKLSIIK